MESDKLKKEERWSQIIGAFTEEYEKIYSNDQEFGRAVRRLIRHFKKTQGYEI